MEKFAKKNSPNFFSMVLRPIWGLCPLVWEEIENGQTVHKGLANYYIDILFQYILAWRRPLQLGKSP
jgi:hypothetical protein